MSMALNKPTTEQQQQQQQQQQPLLPHTFIFSFFCLGETHSAWPVSARSTITAAAQLHAAPPAEPAGRHIAAETEKLETPNHECGRLLVRHGLRLHGPGGARRCVGHSLVRDCHRQRPT